jgi:hypothetical protein
LRQFFFFFLSVGWAAYKSRTAMRLLTAVFTSHRTAAATVPSRPNEFSKWRDPECSSFAL